MLRLTLARDQVLCGYGSHLDPSIDLKHSGDPGLGCRPSIFFGPERDALNLITQKLHAALIIRPKTLKDLEPRLYVGALPGGYPEVESLWQSLSQQLAQQIRPKLIYTQFRQVKSELAADCDLYKQSFVLDGSGLPPELYELSLNIQAGLSDNALREQWHIKGLASENYQAWLVYWYEAEIAAAAQMLSTIFYEPARALTSYRGPVTFSLQAMQGDQSLPIAFAECGAWQHQRAALRFPDIIKSIWYRDELFGMSYAGQHAAQSDWLPLDPESFCTLGQTDGIIAWPLPLDEAFELRFRLSRNFDGILEPLPPLEQSFATIAQEDRAWLQTCQQAPQHVPADLQKRYQRTLLTLRQMQDPGGGIIAAPEFHYKLTHCGGYSYCWGRDAGFISYAMDICGLSAESARFYRYMQLCQSADGSFLHRHDMQGHLGSSWGLLQPDETASVVFGLWQHVKIAEDRALAEELRVMLDKAAHWLCESRHPLDAKLPIPGFDLWEEREGVHFYSLSAMIAGIRAALDLYAYMGWSAPESWQQRWQELKSLAESEVFLRPQPDGKTSLVRTLYKRIPSRLRGAIEEQGTSIYKYRSPSGRPIHCMEADYVFDIAQVAAVYPYQTLDLKQHGELYRDLLFQLRDRLWRQPAGGLGRYEGDHYRDANPWILTTLWLALAASVKGKGYESDKQELSLAKECWQWVLDHIPEEGQLPEQVDPVNGRPSWVMPLTWSHAMFALAIQQLPKEVYT